MRPRRRGTSKNAWRAPSIGTYRPPLRRRRAPLRGCSSSSTKPLSEQRHLLFQQHVLPARRRCNRCHANFQIGETPAAIVQGGRAMRYGVVELGDHTISRRAIGRQRNLRLPLVRINRQTPRRLPDVAALATDQRQAEERLERRAAGNRGFGALSLRAQLCLRCRCRRRPAYWRSSFRRLQLAPFAYVEAQVRAREPAVAVIDRRRGGAVLEVDENDVRADAAPVRVPIKRPGAHASGHAAAQEPEDVELVRTLAK